MTATFESLLEVSKEIYTLQSAAKLLGWDQHTYMPPKAAESRSEQRALLARLIHERLISDRLHQLLEELDGSPQLQALGPEAVANVRELRRDHDRGRNVPPSLVDEIARTVGLAHQPWVEAKRNNDFRTFAPWLEKLVRLHREWADAVGFASEPYDALLESYEPGVSAADLDQPFQILRGELVDLVQQISEAPRRPDTTLLRRNFDAEKLRGFAYQIVQDMGFDFAAGRIDAALHPFCSGVTMADVRLTTYVNESNPLDAVFATVHEAGHGLYHQGLLPKHRGTPMGTAISLGVHESQARWWENFVARGRPFWQCYFPKLRAGLPEVLDDVSLDPFVFAINAVTPSLIRVEADEVTYNLHILLRVELERALFNDQLRISDLPAAWNERTEHYLGIRPSTDSEGVLQDVHWSNGTFGYFPTYTLGNLYAAQIDHSLRAAIPELDVQIQRGEFQPALDWLRAEIHNRGSLYPPLELIRRVTGNGLGIDHLVSYLRGKFGALYDL